MLKLGTAVRIRVMSARAIRTTSRVAFFLCGLISLFTGVPFLMLRGAELPVQSEWVIFVATLALVGLFSVTLAVLPGSWIAKACKKDRDDETLVLSVPQMARWLRRNFISPSARRLSCSAPLESRSPTDAFAVSVVFGQNDVRPFAGDHL